MVAFLQSHPFPLQTPAGQELWRTLAGLVPAPLDAIALAETFDVDSLESQACGKHMQMGQGSR